MINRACNIFNIKRSYLNAYGDFAPASPHTTGHAILRIRRLNQAE